MTNAPATRRMSPHRDSGSRAERQDRNGLGPPTTNPIAPACDFLCQFAAEDLEAA